jgi:23S rRNA pseudouridine1911/1915/1917 synthase
MEAEQEIPILYEDNHLLIINKPAGLSSQPNQPVSGVKTSTTRGDDNVFEKMKQFLQKRDCKPNAFLNLNHRLDKPVSGLMILSKTSKATTRINEMLRKHQVRKLYLAVVCGAFLLNNGDSASEKMVYTSYLSKTGAFSNLKLSPSAKISQPKEKASSTKFSLLKSFPDSNFNHKGAILSLLQVELLSGRKHQIRSQLSSLGYPIYNDYLYNAVFPLKQDDFPSYSIALHSYHLLFPHPVNKGEVVDILCPPPPYWNEYFKVDLS